MDKQIFLPFLVLASSLFYSSGGFTEGSIIGVAAESPASNQIVTVNLPGTDPAQDAPWVWHTVDISGLVPPDTKAVFINVMYAISSGNTRGETCMILFHLRKTGTNPAKTQVSKTVLVSEAYDLERDNYTDWIAVQNGRFDFMWEKYPDQAGDYPAHCAIGFAIKLSAYLR